MFLLISEMSYSERLKKKNYTCVEKIPIQKKKRARIVTSKDILHVPFHFSGAQV